MRQGTVYEMNAYTNAPTLHTSCISINKCINIHGCMHIQIIVFSTCFLGGNKTPRRSKYQFQKQSSCELKCLVGIYQQLIRMIYSHKITDNLMIIDLFPNASIHSIMIMSPCALANISMNHNPLFVHSL